MVSRGLLVRMEAKAGEEPAVEEFLQSAVPLLEREPNTAAWFAVRFGRGEYGIFDAFADDAGRDAHLNGAVAKALMDRAAKLLEKPPSIERVDVLHDKLPALSMGEPATKGLLLVFSAKKGREADVERFLRRAQDMVDDELRTTAWFALRFQNGEFGIFDVFPDNGARFTHLTGRVPRELAKHALTLLGGMPDMQMLDVLAEKLEFSAVSSSGAGGATGPAADR
jgi:quinol monooxygenase YgiN